MRTLLFSAALACAAGGQPPAPGAAGQKAILSRMREAALGYSDQLQNFVCTQVMTRSTGPSPTGPKWKPLDTQETELAYVDGKWHYQLLKARHAKHGFKSFGEFGSTLQAIFAPKANAVFEWDHAEGNMCVFRCRVREATSAVQVYGDRHPRAVGHRGMVWGDCASGTVTRFTSETDPVEVTLHGHLRTIAARGDVRYGPVTIRSKEFLLPQSAVTLRLLGKTWTKLEIRFRHYRKYDANSNIKFDEPDKP